MHLQSIEINNFRPFYGNNVFEFGCNNKINLNIISGKNGVGKSEFLNSIYWCLYGQELLNGYSQPLSNYNSINDAGTNETIEVSVACKFIDVDKIYSIKRIALFVKKDPNNLSILESNFETSVNDMPVVFENIFINHHFPKFLFSLLFDVEEDKLIIDEKNNLKLFFEEFTKLFIIDKVNSHLSRLSKSYINDLMKLEKNQEGVAYLLKKRNFILEDIKKNKEDIKNNFAKIKKFEDERFEIEIKTQSDYFKSKGLDDLIINKNRLKQNRDLIIHNILDIEKREDNLIFKLFPIVVSTHGVKIKFNNEKFENTNFMNTRFYYGYLNIINLFKELKHVDYIKKYIEEKQSFTEEMERLSEEYVNLSEKIKFIDDENFKKLSSRLKYLDKEIEILHMQIDQLEDRKKWLIKDLKHVEREISRLGGDYSTKSNELRLDFCENLLKFGERLKFQLIEDNHNNFSKIINHIFIDCLEMNIKFRKINVDKTFEFSITKNSNQIISIKDLSSNEKRLFKFSLMFTINQILEFRYPIVLMDPFVNLDENRKNKLLDVILNKEFNNQIILIINENQYDDNIKERFLKNNVVENRLVDYECN